MVLLPIIRAATATDLPAIARLHAASWRTSYDAILPPDRLGAPLDRWLAEKWRPEAGTGRWVLVAQAADDALAGFAAIRPDERQGALLDNLHVRPDLKGRGIGRALTAAAAATVSGAFRLEVLAENHAARAVYGAWGGTEGPVFEDDILGFPVPAITVSWPDAAALARRLAGEAGA
jgi:ribosomal protein S18 acetylase RimI-like enzyme